MPIHDWTRLEPGDFHDFRLGWVVRIADALNGGLLPPSHIAMVEPASGRPIPVDVARLHTNRKQSRAASPWPRPRRPPG